MILAVPPWKMPPPVPTVERVSYSERICQGVRCQREPRAASGGAYLCVVCARALTADLRALPPLYDECGRLLGGRERRPDTVRTSRGGPAPGLPFNTAAADARDAVLTVLASWSGLVAEERRVAPPPREVADLARFMLRHLPWLAAHPAAPELSREIGQATRLARQANDPDPLHRAQVGTCVEAGCQGTLTAVVRSREAALAAEVVCSADRAHRWPTEEWVRLSSRMYRLADGGCRWLSPTEIARLWHVATGSVYRMASEHDWTRHTRDGRVYYRADDVHLTFAARAAQLFGGMNACGTGTLVQRRE
jgi:hypothetical protein